MAGPSADSGGNGFLVRISHSAEGKAGARKGHCGGPARKTFSGQLRQRRGHPGRQRLGAGLSRQRTERVKTPGGKNMPLRTGGRVLNPSEQAADGRTPPPGRSRSGVSTLFHGPCDFV